MLAYLYWKLCKVCIEKKKINFLVFIISSSMIILNYLIVRINDILNTNL